MEWVDISSSRRLSRPRDRTWVSILAGGFFTAKSPAKSKPNSTDAETHSQGERELGVHPRLSV